MSEIEKTFNYSVFDFIFSFAGEDRVLVNEIYCKLKEQGYNIFYDKAYQSQLVGTDLYTELRKLYKNKGTYVVCFISKCYTHKVWTNLEFTAIKERLMSTFFAGDFLIPILIDDVEIVHDIPSFIGCYKYESVDNTVQMLVEKISASTIESNFISNINNFITCLCEQINSKLKISGQNIQDSLIPSNEIFVSNTTEPFSLIFSPDPDAQSSCILVNRFFQNSNDTELFPMFIITWQKNKKLDFFIHEFACNTDENLQKLSFSELVEHFSVYIRLYLEGRYYE